MSLTLSDDDRRLILNLLHERTDRDFSAYRWKPFARAVQSRMEALKTPTTSAYLKQLARDRDEASHLLADTLIGVTSFFRDRGAFETLKRLIRSRILPEKAPGEALRVWVPACSTGQEPYSLSILLDQLGHQLDSPFPVEILASDINPTYLDAARIGDYSSRELEVLPPQYRQRYFTATPSPHKWAGPPHHQIRFVLNDVFTPPFTPVPFDLISCRNLLIYLLPSFQQSLLEIFRENLADHGLLFLGLSEHAETLTCCFEPLDRVHKIFAPRHDPTP